MFEVSPETAHAAAKLAAGSWVGATVAALWKRGMAAWERAAWHIGSMGSGFVLGGYVTDEYGMPIEVSGFIVGLLSMTIAFKLLKAAERFDAAEMLKAMLGIKR